MKKWSTIIIILFVILSPGYEMVLAEGHVRVSREDMIRVAKQMYPPGSMGMTVDYCTLPTAATMRQEIVDKLRQGLSDEEVLEAMVERYGEQVLAAPTKQGFNLTLWSLPIIFVLLGVSALFYYLWRKFRKVSFHRGDEREDSVISIEEQQNIELTLKKYLLHGLETEEHAIGQYYQELMDIEHDYLMAKLSHKDYKTVKLHLYHQILLQQNENTAT